MRRHPKKVADRDHRQRGWMGGRDLAWRNAVGAQASALVQERRAS